MLMVAWGRNGLLSPSFLLRGTGAPLSPSPFPPSRGLVSSFSSSFSSSAVAQPPLATRLLPSHSTSSSTTTTTVSASPLLMLSLTSSPSLLSVAGSSRALRTATTTGGVGGGLLGLWRWATDGPWRMTITFVILGTGATALSSLVSGLTSSDPDVWSGDNVGGSGTASALQPSLDGTVASDPSTRHLWYGTQEMADAELREGNAVFRQGDASQAIRHYSKALSILKTMATPAAPATVALLHINRAAAYSVLSAWPNVLSDAASALRYDSTAKFAPRAHAYKAYAYYSLEDFTEAGREFDAALAAGPNDKDAPAWREGRDLCVSALKTQRDIMRR